MGAMPQWGLGRSPNGGLGRIPQLILAVKLIQLHRKYKLIQLLLTVKPESSDLSS